MKYCLLIALACFIACTPQPTDNELSKSAYSPQQKKLSDLANEIKDLQYSSMNNLQKNELKQKYFDSVRSLLADSFNFMLPNFKVKVYDIDVHDLGNIKALVAEFHDNDGSEYSSVTGNEYWMEFDYPKDSLSALQNNPAYKLLKGIPNQTDTTLSFFYLGEVEENSTISNQLRIRVVPFPKDFNFDSSKQANLKKKRLN